MKCRTLSAVHIASSNSRRPQLEENVCHEEAEEKNSRGQCGWPKKHLAEIQAFVCTKTGDTRGSVKGWILDWERGKQEEWKPIIK